MSALLNPDDFYHIGVVVPDVASAAKRLTAAAGYAWTKPVEAVLPISTSDGERDVPFSFVYSLQAPHIELVQEVPDTLWSTSASSAAHHLGYWVDDVAASVEALQHHGYLLEARPSGGDFTTFAYLRDPTGVRIEVVNRALFPDWAGFLQLMSA